MDLPTVELPNYSMFATTPFYMGDDGELVFGLRRDPVLPDSTDKAYTVEQFGKDKLWLISELFYKTKDLWWVISSVNNVVDPLVGVKLGTTLRIPTVERLASEGILN
jgi:hypothetical protein